MKRATILSASAGSGKTYQLAYKYVRDVIERPELYRAILAVTFTNKATEEMKSRILREIHILASGDKSNYLEKLCAELNMSEHTIRKQAMRVRTAILHDYSRFSVLTIDKFFQRIIRAFIQELGIDLNYNIELDHSSLLARSADRLVEKIAEDKDLKRWMLEFVEERITDGERWDMRGDLRSLGNEIFKENSKERIKLHQSKKELESIVADIIADADKAKAYMTGLGQSAVAILKKYNLDADAFAGKSRSFVYRFFKYAAGDRTAPTATMLKAADNIDAWYSKDAGGSVRSAAIELQQILKELCTSFAAVEQRVNTANLLRGSYRSFALLADLSEHIDDICDKENIMVLGETKNILSTFVDGSNAPFIYEKVGNRFERFMIDEFQDTSVREWQNMLPLLQNAMAASEACSVFIVGDVKQSIYRWRGGDWRLLQDVAVEDLGRENVFVDSLEHNFRSHEKVVDFNRKLIESVVSTDNQYINNIVDNALNNNHISKSLHSSLYNIVGTAYNKHKQIVGKKYDDEGYAEITFFDKTLEDSPFIEIIEDAVDNRGYKYRDILILVRGKKDGRKVAERLFAYKEQSKRNFNVLTSDSLTIENSDITQFVISIFRLAVDPTNNVERGVYNRFLGKPFEHHFDSEEREFLKRIAHLSPMEAFEAIIVEHKLYERKGQIAYLQAMHEGVVSFSTSRISDIQHYLNWWDEKGKNDVLSVEMTDDTIEISTIHKAKGLERDLVIIPYCKWETAPKAALQPVVWSRATSGDAAKIGEFPVIYGKDMQNSAFTADYYSELVMSHVDAVNLLYVAVTRASKELYVIVPTKLNTKSKSTETINNIVPLLTIAANTYFPNVETFSNVDGVYRKTHRHGTPLNIRKREEKKSMGGVTLNSYTSHLPKVKILYPSQRYTEEGLSFANDLQRLGIRLHHVFEGALTFDDLSRNITRMENEALISAAEACDIRAKIAKCAADERVCEWFSEVWDDVKCESEIIHSSEVRRPDRVMICGRRAVVVDYKFVDNINSQYLEQVYLYMDLLSQMNIYDEIEGYVWYVNLGEISKVVK